MPVGYLIFLRKAISEMTCSPKVTRPESISKQRFPQVNVKDESLAAPAAESATLRRNTVRILASNISGVQGLLI
jgi:hypothetical protein